MKKKKVLFISSTGGHLNELLQLSPLFEKYDYHIITEKDKTNEYLKEKYGKKVKYLPYGTRSHLLKYIFLFNIKNNIFIHFNKTKSNSNNRYSHGRTDVLFRKNIWK